MQVIRSTDLPGDKIARDFIGRDHGGLGFTFILVDAGPGEGPKPHRHAYPEVLIVLEGVADATVDGKIVRVTAGDIIIVPTRAWHSFVNAGTGRLRQVDIHASSHFITEWMAGRPSSPSAPAAPAAGCRHCACSRPRCRCRHAPAS